MNVRPVSDERVRAVRGRFRDSPTWRFMSRSVAVLLVFLSPIARAAGIWSRGLPVWPLTSSEWIVLIAAAGTLERRCGVIQWRVPISIVTRVRLERDLGVAAYGRTSTAALSLTQFSSSLSCGSSCCRMRPNQSLQPTAGRRGGAPFDL
jgi:hypothetical protein